MSGLLLSEDSDQDAKDYFEKMKRGNGELLVIEDAHILFPNFRGIPDRYTVEGHRHFCVEIPEIYVKRMLEEGWHVKITNPKNEEYEPVHYIDVNINWNHKKNKIPYVTFITSGNETVIDEEVVGDLDTAELDRVNLAIEPSPWQNDKGEWKIKGYVKSLEAFLYEDPIRRRRYERMSTREEELPFGE